LWSKMVYPAVLPETFMSNYFNRFSSFFIWVQNSLPRKTIGRANASCTSVVENFSNKIGLNRCLGFPVFEKILLLFLESKSVNLLVSLRLYVFHFLTYMVAEL
jgi:hypothetical protein